MSRNIFGVYYGWIEVEFFKMWCNHCGQAHYLLRATQQVGYLTTWFKPPKLLSPTSLR